MSDFRTVNKKNYSYSRDLNVDKREQGVVVVVVVVALDMYLSQNSFYQLADNYNLGIVLVCVNTTSLQKKRIPREATQKDYK